MPRHTSPEIDAGELDKHVTIMKPVYNESEDEIVDWVPLTKAWASIQPAFGQEMTQSGRTIEIVDVTIIIRYRADVDARMRVAYRAETYQIRALLNADHRRARLGLLCKEVT